MNPVTQPPRHPKRQRPKSNSIALTDAFVAAYRDAVPSVTVDVMNVWDERLPEFDNAAIRC